jgi:thiol-disulfide isomerase/thioredoxin
MRQSRLATLAVAVGSFVLTSAVRAQEVAQHWVGFATVHDQQVPVRLDLSVVTKNGKAQGSFVNAAELSTSTSGELTGSHLILHFDYFARKLEGELQPQSFKGTYGGAKGTPVPIELHPEASGELAASLGPITDVPGDWEIAVKSPKGESAWTLRVFTSPKHPGYLKAVILRIDGDTGALVGTFDASRGEYRVSHFEASGAALYSLKPQSDGTLLVTNLLRDGQQWTARRPAEARKENLAPPIKDNEQTGLVDPSKPLQFSALDLSGKTVTENDPRFKEKVVIVAIGGSWCPNCHDEAPFLVELYKRYHAEGLEIVNISFEEEEELKNPERLRAFVAKYQIPYPVLLGGTPDQLNEKIPQGKNLNCWPTTFFIGRDGLVKEVHAGFSGPVTGTAHTALKEETDALVERLLAETKS